MNDTPKLRLVFWLILTVIFITFFGLVYLGLDFVDRQGAKRRDPLIAELKEEVLKVVEHSYAQGQLDALHGDWRVQEVSTTQWYWVKSPWDDGSKPRFGTFAPQVEKADPK
jgi:hypothetical protein